MRKSGKRDIPKKRRTPEKSPGGGIVHQKIKQKGKSSNRFVSLLKRTFTKKKKEAYIASPSKEESHDFNKEAQETNSDERSDESRQVTSSSLSSSYDLESDVVENDDEIMGHQQELVLPSAILKNDKICPKIRHHSPLLSSHENEQVVAQNNEKDDDNHKLTLEMSYKSPYALSDEDKQLIQNKMVEFVTDILRNNKAKSMLDSSDSILLQQSARKRRRRSSSHNREHGGLSDGDEAHLIDCRLQLEETEVNPNQQTVGDPQTLPCPALTALSDEMNSPKPIPRPRRLSFPSEFATKVGSSPQHLESPLRLTTESPLCADLKRSPLRTCTSDQNTPSRQFDDSSIRRSRPRSRSRVKSATPHRRSSYPRDKEEDYHHRSGSPEFAGPQRYKADSPQHAPLDDCGGDNDCTIATDETILNSFRRSYDDINNNSNWQTAVEQTSQSEGESDDTVCHNTSASQRRKQLHQSLPDFTAPHSTSVDSDQRIPTRLPPSTTRSTSRRSSLASLPTPIQSDDYPVSEYSQPSDGDTTICSLSSSANEETRHDIIQPPTPRVRKNAAPPSSVFLPPKTPAMQLRRPNPRDVPFTPSAYPDPMKTVDLIDRTPLHPKRGNGQSRVNDNISQVAPRNRRFKDAFKNQHNVWWMSEDYAKERKIGAYQQNMQFPEDAKQEREAHLNISRQRNAEPIRTNNFIRF